MDGAKTGSPRAAGPVLLKPGLSGQNRVFRSSPGTVLVETPP